MTECFSLSPYNAVMVLAIHQGELATGIHVPTPASWTPSPLPPHPTPRDCPRVPALGGPASCIEPALAIYVTQDRFNRRRRGHVGQNSERRVRPRTHQRSLSEEVFTHVGWLSGYNSAAPEVWLERSPRWRDGNPPGLCHDGISAQGTCPSLPQHMEEARLGVPTSPPNQRDGTPLGEGLRAFPMRSLWRFSSICHPLRRYTAGSFSSFTD